NIRAADGFGIDLAPLVARVRAADRGHVHAAFDPVPVEDRIPGGRGGLYEIAAFYGFAWRAYRAHLAPQLCRHRARKCAAVVLVRAENFNLIEIVLRREELEMRARLPSAAKQSEHLRFFRRKIA